MSDYDDLPETDFAASRIGQLRRPRKVGSKPRKPKRTGNDRPLWLQQLSQHNRKPKPTSPKAR